ncbi:hypothetical protein A33Q_0598 [Indibacter alkaliphilus LW1]|uniref:Uncharacterized protein n=1 Tax=Indibacter alkaliphilus (strain CCUG 57479 / KCTC 22604 / LW1) TaxID=1189612 RepID=S2DPU4_INDAL|nr:hypothetical protein A33Q_0598 [Indibacter alkaliphilus LW1]
MIDNTSDCHSSVCLTPFTGAFQRHPLRWFVFFLILLLI